MSEEKITHPNMEDNQTEAPGVQRLRRPLLPNDSETWGHHLSEGTMLKTSMDASSSDAILLENEESLGSERNSVAFC